MPPRLRRQPRRAAARRDGPETARALCPETKYRIAGAAAGAVNGLFGGGGGIPLLMLLTRWSGLDEKNAFATCVAVIFPFCVVSAAVLLLRGGFPFADALPYLAGGLLGGWIGGQLFRRVPGSWLRRGFALFLLYGAWRYLT